MIVIVKIWRWGAVDILARLDKSLTHELPPHHVVNLEKGPAQGLMVVARSY